MYNAPASATVDLQPLLDEQLFLIAPLPPQRRRKIVKSITLPQLADYPLIIPSRPHAMRMSVENALADVDRKIQVAHEIECIPAIIDLVRQGHGFAVLPIERGEIDATGRRSSGQAHPRADAEDFAVDCDLGAAAEESAACARPSSVVRDIVRQEIRSRGATALDMNA